MSWKADKSFVFPTVLYLVFYGQYTVCMFCQLVHGQYTEGWKTTFIICSSHIISIQHIISCYCIINNKYVKSADKLFSQIRIQDAGVNSCTDSFFIPIASVGTKFSCFDLVKLQGLFIQCKGHLEVKKCI